MGSSSTSNTTIYLDYLSVCYSSFQKNTAYGISLYYGGHIINNGNFSKNFAASISVLFDYHRNGLQMIHNTFIKNEVSSNTMAYFNTQVALINGDISYCHIIENDSPGSTQGVIHMVGVSGSTIGISFRFCIFFNNSNILLTSHSGGKFNILTCYIIHNLYDYTYLTTSSATLSTSGNTIAVITTNTYVLSHLSTYLCETLQEITPLEVSPCQTIPIPPTNCIWESKMENAQSLGLTTLFHLLVLSITSIALNI